MSKTSIEWSQFTWNPTTGCTVCSAGCARCYALPQSMRNKAMGLKKYENGFEITMHVEELLRPYRWKKGRLIFVNSMSDLFHPGVTDEFIKRVFKVMNETPQHTYQVLTKRADRMASLSSELVWTSNIWAGVSIENMKVINRLDYLKKCHSNVKFLSLEPLLESLPNLNLEGIDQVLVGGESGTGKIRPIKEEWVIDLKNQCRNHKVAFFFKQWGHRNNNPNPLDPTLIKGHQHYAKGGCQLHGVVYREFPLLFQPKTKAFVKQLDSKSETQVNNQDSALKSFVGSLSPFKKIIGEALINGESPDALTTRFSVERAMPKKTAQAYVTMVVDKLEKYSEGNLNLTSNN